MLANSKLITDMGYSFDTIRAYDYYFACCEANFMLGGLYIGHFIFDKVSDLYQSSNAFHLH